MLRSSATSLLLVISLFGQGCDSSEKNDAHATTKRVEVINPRAEVELTTIKLSEPARQHLAIKTQKVKRERVQGFLTYGGVGAIPEGRSITISCPLTGTILESSRSPWPTPGSNVSADLPLFDLMPSLRGEREILGAADRISLARARADLESARVQAQGDVDSAKVKLEAARIALERAETLVKESAGSIRALDEAKANHRLAQTELEAAHARLRVLNETSGYLDGSLAAGTLPMTPPFNGILQRLFVAKGEMVSAGAQLCEIAAVDPLWIRASIYPGDLDKLAADQDARISTLGADEQRFLIGRPVSAPPTASPTTAAIDRYYELGNADGALLAGQRLKVLIPTRGEIDSLVIASSALLHDIHGDQWVYRESAPSAYTRQRVLVRDVLNNRAVLSGGVKAGDLVVTEGAAELFGVEFGSAGH